MRGQAEGPCVPFNYHKFRVISNTACAPPKRITSRNAARVSRLRLHPPSGSRRALYIGMTNNLHRRVFEHKTHRTVGFTDAYNATRLVYWQSFDEVSKAINREKQLKGWRREKKL